VFVGLGWVLLAQLYPQFELQWVLAVGIVISFMYLGLIVGAHMQGVIKLAPHVTKYLKVNVEDSVWSDADQGLKTFYKVRGKDFLVSLIWQFLGWSTASIEVYIAFRILGLPITWAQAFIFQSTLQAIKTASFMIPANVGAQETGLSLVAIHLGYSATDGFALSLIKRFRQVVWIVGGLCLWKWTQPKEV